MDVFSNATVPTAKQSALGASSSWYVHLLYQMYQLTNKVSVNWRNICKKTLVVFYFPSIVSNMYFIWKFSWLWHLNLLLKTTLKSSQKSLWIFSVITYRRRSYVNIYQLSTWYHYKVGYCRLKLGHLEFSKKVRNDQRWKVRLDSLGCNQLKRELCTYNPNFIWYGIIYFEIVSILKCAKKGDLCQSYR